MTELNATALAALADAGISPEAWERICFYRGWHGDACGCPDDRCIGHHHEEADDWYQELLLAWLAGCAPEHIAEWLQTCKSDIADALAALEHPQAPAGGEPA